MTIGLNSYTIERFGDRVKWMIEHLQRGPDVPEGPLNLAAVFVRIQVLTSSNATRKTWQRYCNGESRVPDVFVNALLHMFPDVDRETLLRPTHAEFEEATKWISATQNRWRAAVFRMASDRATLADLGKRYYREVDQPGGFPLVIKPGWLPTKPILLDEDSPLPAFVDGPDAPPGPRLEGLNIDYMQLKLRMSSKSMPAHNGDSYRLLDVAPEAGSLGLTFGPTSYFNYVNSCEVLGVELADYALAHPEEVARVLADPTAPFPGMLERRNPASAIFDLRARSAFAGVNCLLMLRNFFDRNDSKQKHMFAFHWRGEATLEGQNVNHVVPAGGHQPLAEAFGDDNEVSVWRTVVREFCEELYSKEEASTLRRHGEDFLSSPDVKVQIDAFFRSGAAKVHLLGVGLDPVTSKPEILVAIVVDWPKAARRGGRNELKFDENYEGRVICRDLSKANLQRALTSPPGERPWLPAGQACLELAIQHYDELMGPEA